MPHTSLGVEAPVNTKTFREYLQSYWYDEDCVLICCPEGLSGTVADICVIYARPSKQRVRQLVSALSGSFSVWWDELIHSGDYREEIERQLQGAKCVIPVWCRVSRADADVIDEATFAGRRKKRILPVRIEDVDPPLGFGSLHTMDMIAWNGDPNASEFISLKGKLEEAILARPPQLTRPRTFRVDDKDLDLPVFFRSVSSHETAIAPDQAIHALSLTRAEAVLVSAYDLVNQGADIRERMTENLGKCRAAGSKILLDSGNYEAYRKQDRAWTAEKFAFVLSNCLFDMAFCFDDLTPPSDIEGTAKRVIEAVERDSRHTPKPVLPIVHAPRTPDSSADKRLLPELLKRIARHLRPPLIAVPERELGSGMLERARTAYLIRRSLDELGFYQPIHLLGTGNPLSIAVLTTVGADSFDGLEWCRTVADSQTGRLYHFQQYDFFAWQTQMADSPVVRDAAVSEAVRYEGKVIFHNLDFIDSWMRELVEHVQARKLERFLSAKLPNGTDDMSLLEQAVPEIFK